MGLQSALTTALTGLQAAETTINVIGNNVANSNTVGFKASEVVFATQFLQTQSIGSAPTTGSGGTNPRQIGLGVKVAEITPKFSQGTIEISSSPLDVAIQGDGFLVVQGSQGQPLYTRNGQMSLNSLNQVVSSTGQLVLGYGVNDDFELQTAATQPLTIPVGSERVAQETSNATFEGVLNPTVEIASTPSISESQTLGDATVEFIDDPLPAGTANHLDPPSAGNGAETNTGTGSLAAGNYLYRYAWVDDAGEITAASPQFSVNNLTANSSVNLSGLSGNSAPYQDWVLYRTEPGGSTFYEVGRAAIGTAQPITDDYVILGTENTLDARTIDNGSYTYYFTYYNSSTGLESRPSDPTTVSADNSEGSVRIDLDGITPPGSEFNSVRIYRNLASNSGAFRLVDTIDTTGWTIPRSYIDKTPSADIASNDALDFDGPRAGAGTLLEDVQTRSGTSSYATPFDLNGAASGVLRFSGERAGSELDTQELEIVAGVTRVQDLIDFVYDSLGLQDTSNVPDTPFPIGGGQVEIIDGVLRVTSNFGEQNAVEIPLNAFTLQPAGVSAPEQVSLLFSETQQADGPGTTSEFIVYDSLGSPLTVRLTTVLEDSSTSSTTYRWYATSGDSNPTPPELTTVIGNGTLVFDSNGDLLSSPSDRISIQRELTASGSPLEIALDFSKVTALAETDANNQPVSSLNLTSQDGFPPGVLTDFLVTESGVIQGQFSNGTQRILGQLVMARFANNEGLAQVGDGLFTVSVNSGEPIISTPGQDGIGSISAGAVELSNTDIGNDLVEMILAQTQYQAGSRVITATQELLDELLALQR